jgi:hypothetical protein
MSDHKWTQDEIDDDQFRYQEESYGDCCHEDYELDWDGAAQCNYCGERWYLSSDEMTAYYESYDRAHRPPTWRERFWDFIGLQRARLHDWMIGRDVRARSSDDDIPF